jgi:hypothetical protein
MPGRPAAIARRAVRRSLPCLIAFRHLALQRGASFPGTPARDKHKFDDVLQARMLLNTVGAARVNNRAFNKACIFQEA